MNVNWLNERKKESDEREAVSGRLRNSICRNRPGLWKGVMIHARGLSCIIRALGTHPRNCDLTIAHKLGVLDAINIHAIIEHLMIRN